MSAAFDGVVLRYTCLLLCICVQRQGGGVDKAVSVQVMHGFCQKRKTQRDSDFDVLQRMMNLKKKFRSGI